MSAQCRCPFPIQVGMEVVSDDGYSHYQVVEIGFKYNMMDLQAAIGMHQIRRVDHYWQMRLQVWKQYNSAFADLPLVLPAEFEKGSRHGLHLYTLLIDEGQHSLSRDQFMLALHKRNIGTGVHYRSIATHPVYQQRYGWKPEHYPNAQSIGRRTLSIPLSAKLKAEDVNDVVVAVREICTQGH
jgi:dTDP-4-amino-4,6-dideoxygalactose transaminase